VTWKLALRDILLIASIIYLALKFDLRLGTLEQRQAQTPTWTELEATTGLSRAEWRMVFRYRASQRSRG
jgi:hypothetical protein